MSDERARSANTWRSFFRERCADDLRGLADEYPRKRSLQVDVLELYEFDESFTQELFADPDQFLQTGREVLRDVHEPFDRVNVRLVNHPGLLAIGRLRSRHVSELVSVEATVSAVETVQSAVSVAVYACGRCGSLASRRPRNWLKPPRRCSECGTEEVFELDHGRSSFVDVQQVTLEAGSDKMDASGLARLDAVVDDDLVGTVHAGDQLLVTGILRLDGEPPVNRFDFYLDVNSVSRELTEARPPVEDVSSELREAIESRWELLANR